MSVSLTLYKVTDEPNVLNKTLPSGSGLSANITGTFKDPNDFINPEIIIDQSASTISNKNYFKITSSPINRCYFITDITILGPRLYKIKGHVDVLMSFNTDIKALTGIVERQENLTNLYLNDPEILKMSYPLIQHKAFPNSISTYNYFLTVAGGGV